MGFNRRKMEDQRRQAAEKEAAARRATDAQVLEDAERLIAAWNERQAKRADAVLADDRCGDCGAVLVPLGALSGVAKRSTRSICEPSIATTMLP
jgi:hypothetical protein